LSILVTFNTIRLTIFSQKKEIEIMKLVGASNWFIRGPYMVQASICGFLGGLISFTITYLVLLLTQDSVANLLMGFDAYNYYLVNLWPLLLIQILAGVFLGLISSFIAVTRYLRKK
jgi:cell division transport system permease protein